MTDVDEAAKKEVKDILLSYDRTLLVADPRRCEPKKFASAPCLKHVLVQYQWRSTSGLELHFQCSIPLSTIQT